MQLAVMVLIAQVWVEAESPTAQHGSRGTDRKPAACGLQVLGADWGGGKDHSAEYEFDLTQDTPGAAIHLRYARSAQGPAELGVDLDRARIGRWTLPPTGGWGLHAREFRIARLDLGDLRKGRHSIRFASVCDGNNVNLDGFFIAARRSVPEVDPDFWISRLPEELKGIERRLWTERALRIEPVTVSTAWPDDPPETPIDKPSPYLVKAYDTAGGTEFDRDVAWHLLQKERDPRFSLPHAGKVGVVDFISDISIFVDVEAPTIRTHLIDAFFTSGEKADVAIVPVASDSILFAVRAKREFVLRFTASKRPVRVIPDQHFGYGATTTVGRLRWAGQGPGGVALCFDDWDAPDSRIAGAMLCTLTGSLTSKSRLLGDHEASIEFALASGQVLLLAANLRRFGTDAHERDNGMRLYAVEDENQAIRESLARGEAALRRDWGALVAQSLARYEMFPRVTLPRRSWTADFTACLELPLATTYGPVRQMRDPWYVFCRAHSAEPYGWWSYGMHPHEDLSTRLLNVYRPELAQAWMRGHFRLQLDDGEIPYGVHPGGRRKRLAWDAAAPPLLPWEAWTSYLWRPDRGFLEEGYRAGRANHAWWLSEKRTRGPLPLQHWFNFMESVRDDRKLPTWAWTGAAERQEALDLNCYLLVQEKTLALMAEELKRPEEANEFRDLALGRERSMRRHMWSETDGCFYGIDQKNENRQVRVQDISTFLPLWSGLASEEEARRICAHLVDPRKFATKFPVPSLARDVPRYGSSAHWHGANWVQMSLLVMQGLRRYGYFAEAARLARANCEMIFDTLEKTGHFREYYDAETGEGVDLTDYVWSALAASMIVEILFGVEADAEGISVRPALPEGWDEAKIENLRVRGSVLSIHVLPEETRVTVDGREVRGKIRWSDLRR